MLAAEGLIFKAELWLIVLISKNIWLIFVRQLKYPQLFSNMPGIWFISHVFSTGFSEFMPDPRQGNKEELQLHGFLYVPLCTRHLSMILNLSLFSKD